jgi:hypothetical protein
MSEQFTDCLSFSASYNVMGLVTVTYSIIHPSPNPGTIDTSISTGGQTFCGYVTSLSTAQISGTSWFETTVTLIATTN